MALHPQIEAHYPKVLFRDHIRKIAVVKLDHVGDCYASLPALWRLQERFPDGAITVFCGPWAIPIFKEVPFITEIVPIQFFGENGMIGGIVGLSPADIQKLEKDQFDLTLDFRVSRDTRPVLKYIHSMAYAAATPIPEIPTLCLGIQVPENIIHGSFISALVEYLPVVEAGRPYDSTKPICLAYNASCKAKLWGIERMTELGKELLSEGHSIVVGYSPIQSSQTEGLAQTLGVPLLKGNTVQDYVNQVIEKCSIYLGFDTGPSHAVAMAGIPTVTLMGNLVKVDQWIPVGPKVITLHKSMNRPPCGNAYNCPCNYECMQIPVEDVKWAISEFMK